MSEQKLRYAGYLPPRMHAWLMWQSSMEGRPATALLEDLLRQYHAACVAANPETPAIE